MFNYYYFYIVYGKICFNIISLFIFFDIEKAYDKINREKTLEQLQIMGIKGRMLEFSKELIRERWIKVKVGVSTSQNKQTDLGVIQGGLSA